MRASYHAGLMLQKVETEKGLHRINHLVVTMQAHKPSPARRPISERTTARIIIGFTITSTYRLFVRNTLIEAEYVHQPSLAGWIYHGTPVLADSVSFFVPTATGAANESATTAAVNLRPRPTAQTGLLNYRQPDSALLDCPAW
ncbi:MAG TPA: hypothetical protein VF438_03930 [Candidatus Paceibacterota bacterium]